MLVRFLNSLLKYLAAAAVFAALLLLPAVIAIPFDPTFLIIIAMIACSWYLGRGPGLLMAILLEAVLVYFSGAPNSSAAIFVTINRLVLFVGVVLFASSRKAAELRLREEHELLEVTLSSIGDAVIATDNSGHITFLNPVARSLTGWPGSDACGQTLDTVFRVINEETRKPVAAPLESVRRDGAAVDLEFHTILISRDGREIPIDCNGAPIRDLNGNVSGAVIVFHDVSRQRSIARERELLLAKERTARESAEEANALKDDFLATVSHELRTPLNAILGWAAMLKRTPSDTAAVEKALSIIERNATAQNRIIGDILDVSRIVSGKLELDLRPLDLRQIVVEVAESLQPAAKSKSITLEVEISDEKARVLGDPGRLSQVFWNLISNAIKFTMEGGSVTVRLFGGNDVTVEVEDTGVGLDPQAVPLIFERFRQVDSSIKRAHGGLGLGLAIVQHLVELHNGSVEVLSEGSGQGTRFTIRLPRERAATNDGQDAGAEPETDLSALRILVVDDDPDSLEVSCFMLERFGAITRSAETCSDALQIYVDWRPDVLVSDLGMPLEDGYDLISRIRRMNPGGRRSIPSIALTAYAGEKIRQTALAAGYDAHVAKPVDGSMLAAMVKSVCARSERQEENVQ